MKRIICVIIFILFPFVVNGTMLGTRALLRSEAQNQVKFDPNKSDSLRCNDSVWNTFLNRACIQLAMDADVVEEEDTITTVSGTWAYLVDTALIRPLWIVKTKARSMNPLKQIPVAFMEDYVLDTILSPTGSPQAYWMNIDSIHFFPTPVKVDTFLIGYSIYPNYLSLDTSSTNIPLEYREGVVLYTCYLYFARIGLYDRADWYLNQYKFKIADYRATKLRRFDIPTGPNAK
ncbi:MAG: hypothetical protein KAR42_17635 [candidate division Zixibacteria bacterium]|nr:hypothetical protein [candidate division Zixibacteria bacterium]